MQILLFFIYLTASAANYDDLAIKKCKDDNVDWSIHGYWPEYNRTSYPENCNQTKCKEFNINALDEAGLTPQLHKYWFSCPEWQQLFGSNEEFWNHEWCKHATCMSRNVNLTEYFGETIKLFLSTRKQNWYGCCDASNANQCLVHFNSTTTKWLGYC